MNKIEYLIFSGGGVKGTGLGAVITVLEGLGMLSYVKGYAGTSIGAWVACMLAIGYTGQELREMMLHEFSYENVIGDISFLRLITDAKALGLNNGQGLQRMIESKLVAKFGLAHITFKQLFETTGKELKVYVTNLNLGIAMEMDHNREPNMSVALAVRASMSLPFIFDPVVYKGDYLVDGGMVCNFPKHAFPAKSSLGFHFVKSLSDNPLEIAVPLREEIPTRSQYIQQLILCSMREGVSHNLQPDLVVCPVEVGNTKARDFEITYAEKIQLDWLGFKSVYLWLHRMSTAAPNNEQGYDPIPDTSLSQE